MQKKLMTIFILALLSSCLPIQPVKIGMLVSSTGQFSPLLITGRNGAMLAVEEINSQDGIPIELVLSDDKSDKEVAFQEIQGMLEDGIDIFLLSITSGTYAHIEELFKASEVIVLSPTVSSDQFRGLDDHFFRTSTSASIYAENLAIMARSRGLERTTIIYDQNNLQYSEQMISGFGSTVSPNHRVDLLTFDSSYELDFPALAQEASLNGSDSYFCVASPFHTAMLSQRLWSLQSTLLFSPWGISEELIENGGTRVEGAIFYLAKNYLNQDDPDLINFQNNYETRYNTPPSYQSILNYDAMNILYEALNSVATITPASLKSEILSISQFQGVNSQYVFDQFGDSPQELAPFTIERGEIIRLEEP